MWTPVCLLAVFCLAYASAAVTAGSDDWREATLKSDNAFRKRHGSKPLTLNDELNEAAQAWAVKQADACDMEHDHNRAKIDNTYVGENIWSGSGSYTATTAGAKASNRWYCEIVNYRFSNGKKAKYDCKPISQDTGHFTQTVWAATKQVGYGFAFNPNCDNGEGMVKGKYVIVGRYLPGGNVQTLYPENVKYPTKN